MVVFVSDQHLQIIIKLLEFYSILIIPITRKCHKPAKQTILASTISPMLKQPGLFFAYTQNLMAIKDSFSNKITNILIICGCIKTTE